MESGVMANSSVPVEMVPTATNDFTISFDTIDKLVIVSLSVLFLLMILFTLMCILHPKCLLYAYCPFQQPREAEYNAWLEAHPAYGSIPSPSNGTDTNKKCQNGYAKPQYPPSMWNHMLPLRESEHSDWSDISAPEIIEMKQDPSGRKRKLSSRTSDYSSSTSSVASPVHLESRLAYGIRFDRKISKLFVRVIQLGNFRALGPNAATAPYIKVRIYKVQKKFFTFKMKNPRDLIPTNLDTELQTKIQRRTDNPVFNESFDIRLDDPDYTTYAYYLKFLVCDFDKFSRHVVIGEVTRDMSRVTLSSEEKLFNDQISVHTEENLGELHLALMYLPTAEKMSLIVLNGRGLKSLDASKRSIELYIKIAMMYDGRPIKKTKTTSRTGDPTAPIFNETFVFDVPAYQLDNVYFGISVIAVDKDKEDGQHLLGRLYIGVNFDPDTKEQWMEMINNARKQVACWHKLQS